MMVDEVEFAATVNGRSGDRKETVLELLDFCARDQDARCVTRRGRWRRGGNVERSEFALAYLQAMRHILDRILIGKLAHAQKRAAAVVVADRVAALGIYMHVAEMDFSGVIEPHRSGERRSRARDAVAVIVGDGNVFRPVELKRQ